MNIQLIKEQINHYYRLLNGRDLEEDLNFYEDYQLTEWLDTLRDEFNNPTASILPTERYDFQ